MRRLTRLGYWRGLGDGWSTQEAARNVVPHQTRVGALAPARDSRFDDARNGGLFAQRPNNRPVGDVLRRGHSCPPSRHGPFYPPPPPIPPHPRRRPPPLRHPCP